MELQNKRVRFYIRATSYTNQHRQYSDLSLFAQRHMLEFEGNIFFDKCDSNFPRTELNKALQEAKEFDVLVVLNNSVLHIDSLFAELYENVFNDKGVKILKLSEEQKKLEASI
ncbi:hypothetical protein [Paenibacillus glucanolyticus]|uniref:hypothetical protein n=1 Tax=Paenibacillus glucanolyticus TaxID=59843 RepID=UPI0030CBC6CB